MGRVFCGAFSNTNGGGHINHRNEKLVVINLILAVGKVMGLKNLQLVRMKVSAPMGKGQIKGQMVRVSC